jgi:hypothetical protein
MRKAALILLLAIFNLTAAFADAPQHVVSRIEVVTLGKVKVSDESKNKLSEVILRALKENQLFAETAKLSLSIVIEGFIVRTGNTPKLLHQQGGRDTLRGAISLRDMSGSTQIDKLRVSFAFEGFENLSAEVRQEKLFAAFAHAVVDAMK